LHILAEFVFVHFLISANDLPKDFVEMTKMDKGGIY
jgi:hypothetical protein